MVSLIICVSHGIDDVLVEAGGRLAIDLSDRCFYIFSNQFLYGVFS